MSPMNGKAGGSARPNIVIVLADDMGYSDIGCYGSEISTPNLDRLGHGGLRFTQMYNAARCCPSRASLLTGLYPHQTGVGHLAYDLGHPAYRGRLNDRCVTIAEVLRADGYRTLMSGKWHVAGRSLADADRLAGREGNYPQPQDRGFDHWFGTLGGSGSYYAPTDLMRDGHRIALPEGGFYYTDAISNEAAAMVRQHAAAGPFFLYVAYTAPHWPLHALPEDVERYRGRYSEGWDRARAERHERQRDAGLLDSRWPISPRDELAPPWDEVRERDWEDARMATYAAQVDRMDQGIGRILDALDESEVADNTLVMFLSDNGGCAELLREDGILDLPLRITRDGRPVRVGNCPDVLPGPSDTFMSYDLPWANASNAPFRLYKHWVHEGGIATPFIAHWPEGIAPGGIAHQPVHVIDIMATCLDLAGANYPTMFEDRDLLPLEGQSLAGIMCGEPWMREQPLYWEHEGNRAVRDGQWKLVSRHPGAWELYDMTRDRTELADLAARYPDRVRAMAACYDTWAGRCGVPEWERIAPLEAARTRAYERGLGGSRVWQPSRPVW